MNVTHAMDRAPDSIETMRRLMRNMEDKLLDMRPTANGRQFKHRIADGVQFDGIDNEGRTIP